MSIPRKEDDSTSGHYNPYKTADFRERLNRNRNQNIHHRSKAGSQTNLQRQENQLKVLVECFKNLNI